MSMSNESPCIIWYNMLISKDRNGTSFRASTFILHIIVTDVRLLLFIVAATCICFAIVSLTADENKRVFSVIILF